ncbi:Uncharacterised protein [Vibrio cholerae]|uniref:Uncharacterized protein n=1 Tax=Vibrio cholerae TaxID=666 RepID=A0A655VBV1_VIBCL|nr:Uncharacterised protein [Vibrio cholerae]
MFEHLCAHVFEFIGELNLFGDRDTIFSDGWRTIRFIEHNMATFGPERNFDGVGQ